MRDLETISFFLPPIKEQERIVEILELAEIIREQLRQATEKAKGLILRLFEEMFLQNSERDKWPVVTVGEAGNVQLGRQRSPQYQTGRYTRPYLRAANVLEDYIDLSDVLSMDFDQNDLRRYRLQYGDILLVEGHGGGGVGRPAMWRDTQDAYRDCCIQNTLIRYRATEEFIHPEFALAFFLKSFRDGVFRRITPDADLAHLGAERFAKLPIFIPDFNLQEAFAACVASIRETINNIQAQEAQVDKILGSLTAQAFNGMLTSKWREAHPDDSRQSVIENIPAVVSDEEKPDVNQIANLPAGFGNRAAFWKEIPMESRLNAVYSAFLPDAYYNAQTVVDRLNQSGQNKFPEYDVTVALDILSAAGLILPVTLEMPDPANPSGAVICTNAYRLLRSGDDGQSDFQLSRPVASSEAQ